MGNEEGEEQKHYRTYSDLAINKNVKETLNYFLGIVEQKYASEIEKASERGNELEKEDIKHFFQNRKRKTQEAARRFLAHVVGLADEGTIEEQPIDYLDKIQDDLLYLQKLDEKDYGSGGASEHLAVTGLYDKVSGEIFKRERTLADLVQEFELKHSEYVTSDGQFKPEKIVDVVKAIETALYTQRGDEQIEYPYGCKNKKKIAEVYDDIYGGVNKFLGSYTDYTDNNGQFSGDSSNYVMFMLNTAIALGLGDLELVYPVGSLGEIKRTKTMPLKDIKNKVKMADLENKLKMADLENRLKELKGK